MHAQECRIHDMEFRTIGDRLHITYCSTGVKHCQASRTVFSELHQEFHQYGHLLCSCSAASSWPVGLVPALLWPPQRPVPKIPSVMLL